MLFSYALFKVFSCVQDRDISIFYISWAMNQYGSGIYWMSAVISPLKF